MDQRYLKSRLLYSPIAGVFYWIIPPWNHPELLGEKAGTEQESGSKFYHTIQIDSVKYRRGRLAFLYMEGRMPRETIDHINGNSLDDRWANLREATVTENAWNHKTRAKIASTAMGVRIAKSGMFVARIGVNGRQISLGSFATEIEASAAYQQARGKYFGQFA